MGDLIPVETIADKIYLLRKQKVMLDRDPAESVRRGDRSTEESCQKKHRSLS